MHEHRSTFKEPGRHGHPLRSAPKWFKVVAALVFAMWIAGTVMHLIFLRHYLPSHDWLQSSEPYVTIISAAAALLCSVLAFLGLQDEEHRTGRRRNSLVIAGVLLFSLFLFYFPIADLLRRGFPAMIAGAFGDRVEHSFVVQNANGSGGKWCRRGVEIRDMPFMTQLCFVPEQLRAVLHPSAAVTFIGKGTWMGLFVEDLGKR